MSLGRVSPRPVSSAWHQQKGQVRGEALTRVPEAPDVPRSHPPVAGARRGAGPQGRGWCAPRLWAAAAPHCFASVVISLHLEMRQSLPRTCLATGWRRLRLWSPGHWRGKRTKVVCQERPLYVRLLLLPVLLPPS